MYLGKTGWGWGGQTTANISLHRSWRRVRSTGLPEVAGARLARSLSRPPSPPPSFPPSLARSLAPFLPSSLPPSLPSLSPHLRWSRRRGGVHRRDGRRGRRVGVTTPTTLALGGVAPSGAAGRQHRRRESPHAGFVGGHGWGGGWGVRVTYRWKGFTRGNGGRGGAVEGRACGPASRRVWACRDCMRAARSVCALGRDALEHRGSRRRCRFTARAGMRCTVKPTDARRPSYVTTAGVGLARYDTLLAGERL